jgi:hypothetical protein
MTLLTAVKPFAAGHPTNPWVCGASRPGSAAVKPKIRVNVDVKVQLGAAFFWASASVVLALLSHCS